MKITVAGLGYVGVASAVLLAQRHTVTAIDIDADRVAAINARQSPIADSLAQAYLSERTLDLTATTDPAQAYDGAEVVIVSTPTNYDPATNRFDTSSVEAVTREAHRRAPDATIVVKSTIPVGFIDTLRGRIGSDAVLFSPEFLREGRALEDNLHPSRIVVGDRGPRGRLVGELLQEAAEDEAVPVIYCGAGEAEAIKLFANTYLAMRVAYFNELDSYALTHGFRTREIIEGVCADPRVGSVYNNPSFGYGGYCLPKDTRQLLANYGSVPQNLIGAIVEANQTRKDFVALRIAASGARRIGIYRLVMKAGSDNFRDSSILSVVRRLMQSGLELTIYEPLLAPGALQGTEFADIEILRDFEVFVARSDLIVANRLTAELGPLRARVFTRDLYGND